MNPFLIQTLPHKELHLTHEQIRSIEHIVPAILAIFLITAGFYLWYKGQPSESIITHLLADDSKQDKINKILRIYDSLTWHSYVIGTNLLVLLSSIADALHVVPWPKG